MIFSNARKLALSGWLRENGRTEYDSALKLQKFLLFYEAFTKIDGESADFDHLKGYQRGPVFSNVWGDYTHERHAFDEAVEREYSSHTDQIKITRAQKSKFLVSILSEKELSELTHRMNLWKAKESRIMSGEYQVGLCESDFDENDFHFMRLLDQMYPLALIEQSSVVEIDNHYFLLSKSDAIRLTEQHYDILSTISEQEELVNPIYVEIDSEGRLVID